MPLKTPKFWYKKPNQSRRPLRETMLSPLAWLYKKCAQHIANKSTPYKGNIPVICVGNITAGGSGKTPTCLALYDLITAQTAYKSPCFLTRGYGGAIHDATAIDITAHNYNDVGDEALILAQHAPTIVARNRKDGAILAAQNAHDLIIMDDGMQNNTLHKDHVITVIDGIKGFGNQKTIPAGPLRTALASGLSQADSFIIIGEDRYGVADLIPRDKPMITASIKPTQNAPTTDASYIAFAGLGHPDKFFNTLRDHGYALAHTIPFADHHPYSDAQIQSLINRANDTGATLITTQKDMIRIPQRYHDKIARLNITLHIDNTDKLISALTFPHR